MSQTSMHAQMYTQSQLHLLNPEAQPLNFLIEQV